MRSIRTQIVLGLVGGTLALTAAAGAGLYVYMQEVLEHGLDAALAAKAEAIAGAVHMEDDGRPHLQWADTAASAAIRHEGPFYFQIWRDDGTTLARVGPPAGGDTPLPRVAKRRNRFIDSKLSDGTWARVTELSFLARADEDEFDVPPKASPAPPARLALVVAHDRRSIDGPLAVLLSGLLLAATLVTVGIVLIVTWGVRRGLRPLAEVSAMADRISADSLDVRFPGSDQLPPELMPIGLKLNELLDRLSAAFARERRFTAAVAHELRTPLAELRSACDVALRWPDNVDGLSTALSEARDVAMQMSTMVQTLLSLARQQAGVEPASRAEAVHLSTAVPEAWPELSVAAADRRLTIHYSLDNAAVVTTDPRLLAAVLRNLLENAANYTPPGGGVVVRTARTIDGRWSLHLKNTCEGITPADVLRLFEPFWRIDSARAGGGHVGLGLALVQVYCEAMGISVDAALVPPDELELTLLFPK